jgi:hypothetical protein
MREKKCNRLLLEKVCDVNKGGGDENGWLFKKLNKNGGDEIV